MTSASEAIRPGIFILLLLRPHLSLETGLEVFSFSTTHFHFRAIAAIDRQK